MTAWLARPVETLLAESPAPRVGTLVVGSGYGAALAALALVEDAPAAPDEIAVFERGDEYLPEDLPRTLSDIVSNVRLTRAGRGRADRARAAATDDATALWDVRAGRGAVSLTGNGLGGTSLVNASVTVPPLDGVLEAWPQPEGTSWTELFTRCRDKIETLLGVAPVPRATAFAKFRALQRTAQAFGAVAQAAPLSIEAGAAGPHSVEHGPCNACGNCVTGCHSGAKQSLNMNAWPLARQRGVALHTGANVTRLERDGDAWLVHATLSRDAGVAFTVRARRVILAAGAIGSTEILMRSSTLELSPRLGQGFSTNGDGLHFTHGQADAVEAVGDAPDAGATRPVGPTIVGRAVTPATADTGPLTLEDGALPHALAPLLRELAAAQSLMARFAGAPKTAWHARRPNADPLVAPSGLATHGQVLLSMGLDGDHGSLGPEGPDGRLVPNWPTAPAPGAFYARLERAFRRAGRAGGFDGGEYRPNPVWSALPPGFTNLVEGVATLPRAVTTVHPLGGCGMGRSAATGVVDAAGRVFHQRPGEPDSTETYEELYVLDGAAVPGAVGTNPLLSIATLAYCQASRIAGRPLPSAARFETLAPEWRTRPKVAAPPPVVEVPVNADFSERLFHDLGHDDGARRHTIAHLRRLTGLSAEALPDATRTLALDVRFHFAGDASLDRWPDDPERPLRAGARLYALPDEVLHTSDDVEFPDASTLELDGEVVLGRLDRATGAALAWRTLRALVRFARYRPFTLVAGARDALGNAFAPAASARGDGNGDVEGAEAGGRRGLGGLRHSLRSYLRIAALHTERRHLEYRFRSSGPGPEVVLDGCKTLGYGASPDTAWRTLFELPLAWRSVGQSALHTRFRIDLIRVTRGPAPLQVRDIANTPAAVTAVAAAGALLLRMLAQTHFWSFGAHDYRRMQGLDEFDAARMNEPPRRMAYRVGGETRESLPRETYTSPDGLSRLVRYRPRPESEPGPAPALLLVHGLAHSSEIFWTDLLDENYAQHFLRRGYDVWIVDHRTSANSRLAVDPAHTWDEIALIDVPWSVRTVFDAINSGAVAMPARRVHVFSHCIGAGAVSIAALAGRLQQPARPEDSMLASLVPHAVTPWLYASADNRARENAWALVKDLEPIDTVEPRLHSRPTWIDVLFDRLATSTIDAAERLRWPARAHLRDPRGAGFARSVYYRYTVFWGRQWSHDNVCARLRNHFAGMIGPVPVAVLQQVWFSVTRNRLVAHDGASEYVTDAALAARYDFPVLFLHGDANRVFDIESSRLSATRLAGHRRAALLRAGAIRPEPGARTEVPAPSNARLGVQLETFAGYGHMDVIFGTRATHDIGPCLDRFYRAAEAQARVECAAGGVERYARFASLVESGPRDVDARPRTRTVPSPTPLCGPVLSLGGRNSLVLWCETDDYETSLPESIALSSEPHGAPSRRVPMRPLVRHAPPSPRGGRFWLERIEAPGAIDAPLRLVAAHPEHRVPSAPETRDVCETASFGADGARFAIHELPWFRRRHRGAESTTSPEEPDLCVALGSCLHPGTTFEREASDAIFDGIARHLDPAPDAGVAGLDLLLLLGDQIYADATGELLDPRTEYERYRGRYRTAFRGRAMRALMARLPTHFVVDDHAIGNDYAGPSSSSASPTDASRADAARFEAARREAANFQSHRHLETDGPPTASSTASSTGDAEPVAGPIRLWHDLECRGHRVFCLDTRFERSRAPRSTPDALASPEQRDAFTRWLGRTRPGEILFVASGAPVCPLTRATLDDPALARHADGLIAYPGFLGFLAGRLAALPDGVRLVWLTGDPHLSCDATVRLSAGSVRVHFANVVASGLFAPLPFANLAARDVRWHEPEEPPARLALPGGVALEVRQRLHSDAGSQFTRLDLDAAAQRVRLRACGPDGAPLAPERRLSLPHVHG